MKLNHHFSYQNEAIFNIRMQNLIKFEITSMEQILSFFTLCMLKLFQKNGDNNLILIKER